MRRTTSYRSLPLHSGVPAIWAEEWAVRVPSCSVSVRAELAESAPIVTRYGAPPRKGATPGKGERFLSPIVRKARSLCVLALERQGQPVLDDPSLALCRGLGVSTHGPAGRLVVTGVS